MRYAEYTPAPHLAALVERFWLLEGSSTGSADAIIPDGRVELIFHYGGPFWRHDASGDRAAAGGTARRTDGRAGRARA